VTRGAGRRRTGLQSLALRYSLSDRAVDRLSALLDVIERDPLAPTAIRRPEQAINDHLADALVALELDVVRHAEAIADLGSGGGFPGLPLALALPEAEVVMIDSNARKTAFVQRAIAVCELDNAHAVHARVEAWPWGRERFDLVTARALAAPDVVAEYAAPLLRLGGTLAAWRGRRDPAAELAGNRAATVLGLEVTGIIPVVPYSGAQHRHIHLMRKVAETPDRFPRRPGVARKRPLGSPRLPSDRSQR
jgi:16S rRNA (guanine527-N7)-methyltransferase